MDRGKLIDEVAIYRSNALRKAENKEQLVRQAVTLLKTVEQGHGADKHVKLAKQFVHSDLVQSVNKDVRLLSARGICEIFRIFAPQPPFDPAELRAAFDLISAQMESLRSGNKGQIECAFNILHSLSQWHSCVLVVEAGETPEEQVAMTQQLFASALDALIPSQAARMAEDVVNICFYILDELASAVPMGVAEELFRRLTPEYKAEHPAGCTAALQVVTRAADLLQPRLLELVNHVTASGSGRACDSELADPETVHDVVRALSGVQSLMMFVLPVLVTDLRVENADIRARTVALFTDLFVDQHVSPPLSKSFNVIFQEYLSRFHDLSPDIRVQMTAAAGELAPVQAHAVADLLPPLTERLRDPDARVRFASVKSLCDIAIGDILSIPDETLHQLRQRTVDRGEDVRKEALTGLAQCWSKFVLPLFAGAGANLQQSELPAINPFGDGGASEEGGCEPVISDAALRAEWGAAHVNLAKQPAGSVAGDGDDDDDDDDEEEEEPIAAAADRDPAMLAKAIATMRKLWWVPDAVLSRFAAAGETPVIQERVMQLVDTILVDPTEDDSGCPQAAVLHVVVSSLSEAGRQGLQRLLADKSALQRAISALVACKLDKGVTAQQETQAARRVATLSGATPAMLGGQTTAQEAVGQLLTCKDKRIFQRLQIIANPASRPVMAKKSKDDLMKRIKQSAACTGSASKARRGRRADKSQPPLVLFVRSLVRRSTMGLLNVGAFSSLLSAAAALARVIANEHRDTVLELPGVIGGNDVSGNASQRATWRVAARMADAMVDPFGAFQPEVAAGDRLLGTRPAAGPCGLPDCQPPTRASLVRAACQLLGKPADLFPSLLTDDLMCELCQCGHPAMVVAALNAFQRAARRSPRVSAEVRAAVHRCMYSPDAAVGRAAAGALVALAMSASSATGAAAAAVAGGDEAEEEAAPAPLQGFVRAVVSDAAVTSLERASESDWAGEARHAVAPRGAAAPAGQAASPSKKRRSPARQKGSAAATAAGDSWGDEASHEAAFASGAGLAALAGTLSRLVEVFDHGMLVWSSAAGAGKDDQFLLHLDQTVLRGSLAPEPAQPASPQRKGKRRQSAAAAAATADRNPRRAVAPCGASAAGVCRALALEVHVAYARGLLRQLATQQRVSVRPGLAVDRNDVERSVDRVQLLLMDVLESAGRPEGAADAAPADAELLVRSAGAGLLSLLEFAQARANITPVRQQALAALFLTSGPLGERSRMMLVEQLAACLAKGSVPAQFLSVLAIAAADACAAVAAAAASSLRAATFRYRKHFQTRMADVPRLGNDEEEKRQTARLSGMFMPELALPVLLHTLAHLPNFPQGWESALQSKAEPVASLFAAQLAPIQQCIEGLLAGESGRAQLAYLLRAVTVAQRCIDSQTPTEPGGLRSMVGLAFQLLRARVKTADDATCSATILLPPQMFRKVRGREAAAERAKFSQLDFGSQLSASPSRSARRGRGTPGSRHGTPPRQTPESGAKKRRR